MVTTRKSILFVSLILPLTCASLLSCATSQESNKSSVTKAEPPPPIKLTSTLSIPDTPSNDKKIISRGKQLYMQKCRHCHQKDAIGKPGKAPSLTSDEYLSTSSLQFTALTIYDGRPGTGMSPFSYMGEEQIYQVVSYLYSFSKSPSRAKQVDSQPKAKGDVKAGRELFDAVCQPCHGPNGNGYDAGGTGTAIGKIGFLHKASDGFIRTTIKEGRSNTRMKGYQGPAGLANLSDKEIDDIITYLRTVPSK